MSVSVDTKSVWKPNPQDAIAWNAAAVSAYFTHVLNRPNIAKVLSSLGVNGKMLLLDTDATSDEALKEWANEGLTSAEIDHLRTEIESLKTIRLTPMTVALNTVHSSTPPAAAPAAAPRPNRTVTAQAVAIAAPLVMHGPIPTELQHKAVSMHAERVQAVKAAPAAIPPAPLTKPTASNIHVKVEQNGAAPIVFNGCTSAPSPTTAGNTFNCNAMGPGAISCSGDIPAYLAAFLMQHNQQQAMTGIASAAASASAGCGSGGSASADIGKIANSLSNFETVNINAAGFTPMHLDFNPSQPLVKWVDGKGGELIFAVPTAVREHSQSNTWTWRIVCTAGKQQWKGTFPGSGGVVLPSNMQNRDYSTVAEAIDPNTGLRMVQITWKNASFLTTGRIEWDNAKNPAATTDSH